MAKSLVLAWLIAGGLVGAARADDGEPRERVNRRALLVGCTDYQLANLPDLWGPANDVPAWSRTLVQRFGFVGRDVRTLVGWPEDPAGRPTRENIVKNVRDLLDRSIAGDQAVIVLAGHGAQIPAPEAGAAAGHVEVDGLDEVFLPADVKSWEDGWIENAILDDEIGRWLNQFRRKGVHVWVVFDCCHASGLARRKILRPNNDDTDHRGIHFDDLKVPIRAPGPARKPLPIGHAVIEHPGWLDRGWDSGDGSGSVVAFYACQGSELTPELPRPKDAARVPENYYGLFSYTLISALTRSSRPPSYRELRQTIEARYAQDRPGLPPRIAVEGAVDRVALGFSSWPSPPTLALSETEARSWSVDGGELTGLLESSILALHRPKVDPASPKSILGYLQIKELGPIRAIVEPTSYRGCLPVDPNILTTGMTCEIVAD